ERRYEPDGRDDRRIADEGDDHPDDGTERRVEFGGAVLAPLFERLVECDAPHRHRRDDEHGDEGDADDEGEGGPRRSLWVAQRIARAEPRGGAGPEGSADGGEQ